MHDTSLLEHAVDDLPHCKALETERWADCSLVKAMSLESAVSQPHVDYLYKMLLLGQTNVGKSSLLLRFADDAFAEHQVSTIGVDWRIKTIALNDKLVKLQLWDSAGQERFRTIASAYYRGAHGVAIVFDLTSRLSFDAIKYWMDEIDRHAPRHIRRMLIGNKSDLINERAVDHDEAYSYAVKHGMQYLETSAKNAENVTEAFMTMTRQIYQVSQEGNLTPRNGFDVIHLQYDNVKQVSEKKACC